MGFDLYVFFLCLIVFTLLTVLLGGMLAVIIKLTVRLIRGGLEDEKIKAEYLSAKAKGRRMGCFDTVVSWILSLVFLSFFGFSLYVNLSQNTHFDNVPTLKVVNSASMAKKNEKNTYLFDNNLNDQFDTFDLLFTYKLPEEDDLKLYDIVVYEVDDILVVHRIVAIEERNPSHPNVRYFLCQGDAVESPDRFPVYYSQMRAIYKGERIPFVGSFVTFMQSPAGWLCVLLIIASLIGTPILEKKVYNEKRRRLIAIGFLNADGTLYKPSPFDHLRGRINSRTFDEALGAADEEMQLRYERLVSYLSRFEGIRVIESRTRRTYKCKNIPVARFAVRGKTLNANIALSPSEYTASKYIYDDLSASGEYRLYPMRVKLTSERMTRWTIELFDDIAEKFGITILEEEMPIPTEVVEETPTSDIEAYSEIAEPKSLSPFAHLNGKRNNKTFAERLEHAGESTNLWHDKIEELILRFNNVRLISAAKHKTYKCGNTPVLKMTIRGKTLNTYIALPCEDFADSKYIFTDVSANKKYALYPMRLKISSERQARWACELLAELAKRNEITILDKPIPVIEEFEEKVNPFAHLNGKRNNKTFAERLEHAGESTNLWHDKIEELVLRFNNVRLISAAKHKTYKCGNTPVLKMTVRGKTLNTYIALPCEDFADSKYIFTDVSANKKYALYPMRLKISSERQARWACELLSELAKRNEITILDKPLPVIEETEEKAHPFAHLFGKVDNRTFKERLAKTSRETQNRYESINGHLRSIKGIRIIEAKKHEAYKCGNLPIAKLLVKGKTLNVYLALEPKRFENTKYVFTDASSSKKFALYPMRIRVSSERQKRYVLELITLISEENMLRIGGAQ